MRIIFMVKRRPHDFEGGRTIKHLGDICKISGYDAPMVDVIFGGSPCQDLSVAGKRAGMKHSDRGDEETTRSGLFMEQIRIVKEMRERDRANGNGGVRCRPRYMVWENVPGAFSSGQPKGADFAAVIEEIIKVAEPGACVCVCTGQRMDKIRMLLPLELPGNHKSPLSVRFHP